MNSKHLVLGANGSIGFAFTAELLKNRVPVTVQVRNKEKAEKLFGRNPLLEIITGDAYDRNALKELAKDKEIIFHGINYPYNLWEKNMVKVTENIIEAVGTSKATILFPGNNYEFGNIAEITEKTLPNPTTRKGKIRLHLYELLTAAAESSICRVIFLRLPDFFGPNVTNGLIMPIFGNASKKKGMTYLINDNIPHQFVYTPDAAKVIRMLSLRNDLPAFAEFNFASFIAPSFRQWADQITEIGGGPSKVNVVPKWILDILALFNPVLKELKENYYLFENNVKLNDEKVRKLLPEFHNTEMKVMIKETLDWFRENA
jgi:nucleoside-diphosphate-sugar epimerase